MKMSVSNTQALNTAVEGKYASIHQLLRFPFLVLSEFSATFALNVKYEWRIVAYDCNLAF